MKALAPQLPAGCKTRGYEAFSIFDEARGIDDEAIIEKAYVEDWILITNDKDFGEKIYREQFPHKGVILLRLKNERAVVKIETLRKLIGPYSAKLSGSFVVVTENRVRFARG